MTGRPVRSRGWLRPLLLRLHFSAGLLIGPFILVAALTGAAYAATPQIERAVYADQLHASTRTTSLLLSEQVAIAREAAGDEPVVAVRPAPSPGDTTRVMFDAPGLADSETRAVFVDPGTGEIRGDLTVYGTSGALPLRTWLDHLHRSLHLGDVGRLYSELAASWMWVVASAGVVLWMLRFRRTRRRTDMVRPNVTARGYRSAISWHSSLGIWLAVAAMFLSTTGISWSQLAGSNVTTLRQQLSWTAPTVSRTLDGRAPETEAGEHAEHSGHEGHPGHQGHPGDQEPAGDAGPIPGGGIDRIDAVLAIARTVNVDVGEVEILPPTEVGQAWLVQEIRRSHPTAVDAVAIDGERLRATNSVDFDDHPLMAKLARWGIDIHMGSMYGWVNQLVLLLVATGLAGLIVSGYRMWWQRRPGARPGNPPARASEAPWWAMTLLAVASAGVAILLPLLGISLIGFLVIDLITGLVRRRRLSRS